MAYIHTSASASAYSTSLLLSTLIIAIYILNVRHISTSG